MPAYGGDYGYGRGIGFRRGLGRGRGRGFGPAYGGYPYAPACGTDYSISKSDEIEMLRADANAMRKSLEAVHQRIAELDKEETK
jgi:hypothetical protein